jgi:aspartate carbamoyltransferase catalytic subunit
MNEKIRLLADSIGKVIVGKEDTVIRLISAMLCEGHVLLEDVPGVGKTQLITALSRYTGVRFVLISPNELKLPSYVKDTLKDKGIHYTETDRLENSLKDLDILYMTRVQRERFFNEEDYLRLKDTYILTPEKLKNANENMKILHPLPRVNEISVAVDSDPRACYFKQVLYGKYMRMALILMLLEIEE